MSSRARLRSHRTALISSLVDQIGLPGFTVTRDGITHSSGGEIIYRGLARNPEQIKISGGGFCCVD